MSSFYCNRSLSKFAARQNKTRKYPMVFSSITALYLLCYQSVWAVDVPITGEVSEEKSWVSDASLLPSLSARHISWHEPSETELLRANIELSPNGFRVRQSTSGQRHQEMLQDFDNDDAWVIDHRRSIAHRLPLEDDPEDDLPKPADSASFLSQEPCGSLLVKSDAGNGLWRGRKVRAWHCTDQNNNIVSIDFMDSDYGIVVYSRNENGRINELTNLQERRFSVDHFKPASKLRFVSQQEFFGSAPAIPDYQETD